MIDEGLHAGWESSGVLGQELAIQGEKLRDVDHRIARQPRRPGRQEQISRSVGQVEVRREGGDNDRVQVAAVKPIGLNDKDGPAKAWIRTAGLGKVSPPDPAAFNLHGYQLSFGSDLICARLSAGSSLARLRE